MKTITERQELIHKLRTEGLTFKAIGKKVGLSTQLAHLHYKHADAIKQALARPEHVECPFACLSTRAINILSDVKALDKEVARQLHLSGHLNKVRGCGKKTFKEIATWLDIPKASSSKAPPSAA